MQTKYIILIAIYSALSLFLGGMQCKQIWDDEVEDFLDFLGFCFISVIITTLITTPIHLYTGIRFIIKWFDQTLLVRFYFVFYFTKTFDNKDENWLVERNSIARNHFNTKSIHDRIYRYQLQLVNKRNKYTPHV